MSVILELILNGLTIMIIFSGREIRLHTTLYASTKRPRDKLQDSFVFTRTPSLTDDSIL